jgi:hypothetical protein
MSVLALKKWNESKKNKYNIILSAFFVGLIIGIFLNILYLIFMEMGNEIAYSLFSRFSAFCLVYSLTFIPFLLNAFRLSLTLMTKRYKISYFILMAILCSGFLYLGKVYLSEDLILRWDLILALYGFIVLGIITALNVYYSVIVIHKFESTSLKRKFLLFIIGLLIIIWILFSVILVKIDLLNSLISSLSLGIGMIAGPLLIYLGIGKK